PIYAKVSNTMISSVIGGVSAELGGGKFANGARSAAFVSLYNHGSSAYEGDDYSYPNSDGSHYHEVPLGFYACARYFGGWKNYWFAIKNSFTRILCYCTIMRPPNTFLTLLEVV
ncbi:hypothetical protein BSPWISOXPB_4641, partial [uncultured Gammaproteobacteria bacterium]